jgi:glutathione S-transferase
VRWLIPFNFGHTAAELRAAYPPGKSDDLVMAMIARGIRWEMARRHGPRLGHGRPVEHLNRLAEVLDYLEGAIGAEGWLVAAEPTVADCAVAGWIALLRELDGWETVKVRRKLAKLVKALVPEDAGRKAEAAPKDEEAYDAQDQALIDASRLRRARQGQS